MYVGYVIICLLYVDINNIISRVQTLTGYMISDVTKHVTTVKAVNEIEEMRTLEGN